MNLLAVQGLGLSTSTTGDRGSIPGWGSKSCMPCDLAKKKKKSSDSGHFKNCISDYITYTKVTTLVKLWMNKVNKLVNGRTRSFKIIIYWNS